MNYDPSIKVDINQDSKKKLCKLLELFFVNHDYEDKLSVIKQSLLKANYVDLPTIVFTWFS
jgi:hypothetical protein